MPLVTVQLAKGAAAGAAAGASTPARDLKPAEARDLTVGYAMSGDIQLDKPVAFGKDGMPTFPKEREKVRLGLADIGGVQFYNREAKDWTRTYPLDMRLVVLLVRLAQFLKSSKWGVSCIFWGGLGIDGPKAGNDHRHKNGFALDFFGAYTRLGGRFDVGLDWGKQPITLPDGTVTKDNQWPPGKQTKFRLDDDPTGAAGFFHDVYDFLTGEAADNSPKGPSSIGDHSYILHPDHPDRSVRVGHWDHIHCEIDR